MKTIKLILLDAYERGTGLGLIDSYKKLGTVTTGSSYDVNIRNIVHEYLHGVIEPITASIRKNDENTIESIIRALVIQIVDKPEEQQSMIDFEMNRGFTRTQYIYDQMQEFENYQGSLKGYLGMILR